MKFPTLLEAIGIILRNQSEADPFDPNHKAYFFDVTRAYAFYSQSLALWMFVPCGEDGKPIDKPEWYDKIIAPETRPDDLDELYSPEWSEEMQAYKSAQSRVLFEGWDIDVYDSDGVGFLADLTHIAGATELHLRTGGGCKFNHESISNPTIDKLTNAGGFCLTPTQTAITILNLEG